MTRTGRIALALVALTLCYAGVIKALAVSWATSYEYSYGVAVLLASLYMLWTRAADLRTLQPQPDYSFGVPVTVAGIGLLAAGRLGMVTSVQQASLIVTLAGFVLLLFGRRALSIVGFPLAYMLLGIPIWGPVISWLQPPSQVFSARMAGSLLQVIGIPVLRDGTSLMLPNVTLEVMRECSGVNQLLAIVAMALPAGYLVLKGKMRRTILVGLAVVSAYASNGVRITLVGFLAYHGLSNGDLRGMHLFEGLAISLLGYLALFGFLTLLSRGERAGKSTTTRESLRPMPAGTRRTRLELAVLAIALLMGALQTVYRPADVRLRHELSVFPSLIGEWTLDQISTPGPNRFPALEDDLVHAYPSATGERHFLELDDELVRTYRNADGQRVRLYIGYHRSQREGKELAGAAGHALHAVATPVTVRVGSEAVRLAEVTQDLQDRARGVVYWYDLNGRVFGNLYLAKGYTAWDALTRRRTNGAVVMVGWESNGRADAQASRMKAAAFAEQILPLLPTFIPS